MITDVPLIHPAEGERLKTAVYRFAELKRSAMPEMDVRPDAGRIHFPTPEAAAEFRSYWRAFRGEQRSWEGFRDV